jgi:hypothetical protein
MSFQIIKDFAYLLIVAQQLVAVVNKNFALFNAVEVKVFSYLINLLTC